MKRIRLFVYIFWGAFLSFGVQPLLASPSEDFQTAKSYTQFGLIEYQRGNVNEAIRLLSQSLLLNPHDQWTQDSLINITTNVKVQSDSRIKLYQFEDLFSHLRSLKAKINHLQDVRDELRLKLMRKGEKLIVIDKELARIQSDSLAMDNGSKLNEGEHFYSQNEPLELVNKCLNFEKFYFMAKVKYLEKQNNRLREVLDGRGHFDEEMLDAWASSRSSKNEEELFNPFQYIVIREKKSDTVQESKPVMQSQSEDLNDFDARIKLFTAALEEKDVKIKSLMDEVVDLTLKMTERKILTEDSGEELVKLKEELIDSRQMIDLQKVQLQEKQAEIDSLRAYEKTTEKTDENKDQKIKNLKHELQRFQNEVSKRNQQVKELIVRSENQMEQLRKELLAKDIQLTEIQSRLELSQKVIQDKDQQLQKVETDIRSKQGREIRHLEALLALYRQDLSSVKSHLQSIESKYEVSQRKLENASAMIKRRDNYIEALKENLVRRDFERDTKNERLRELLAAKDIELSHLKSTLDLYREKLQKKDKMIEGNFEDAKVLEKRVLYMEDRIDTKNTVLIKTKSQLETLERRLYDIQVHLNKLKEDETILSSNFGNEVYDLHAQLSDLHSVLLEQLNQYRHVDNIK